MALFFWMVVFFPCAGDPRCGPEFAPAASSLWAVLFRAGLRGACGGICGRSDVATSARVWSAVVGIVVVALVWVLFAATELVVDVDKDAVTIRFLYLWPARRVPLADIATIESVRYRPLLDYLGYGVRFGPKGLAYNVSGDRGVKIRLRDGGSFLVGSQRPDELADAIGRAKAARE